MAIRKRGKRYWFRFMWKREWVEKSTRQGNANVARQMEAAYRTALAKGEFGIVERQPAPTLRKFAEDCFLPFVASTFGNQKKTKEYYEYGVKCLLGFDGLANERLASITRAAYRTALAKGEFGIVERQPAPTLRKFAEDCFLPFVASTFGNQKKTI